MVCGKKMIYESPPREPPYIGALRSGIRVNTTATAEIIPDDPLSNASAVHGALDDT